MDDDSPQEDREKLIAQFSEGLSRNDLAKRLGISPQAVGDAYTRYKNNPQSFANWSSERDSQGLAWERREDKKYYPVM